MLRTNVSGTTNSWTRPPGATSRLLRARSRLASLFQLDNLGPAIIIAVSITFSFEPSLFGVGISDRAIILSLFALLGLDAVVERSGRLKSLNDKIDALGQHLIGPIGASKVLRTRSSFERMDVLLSNATRSITIIGINLDGAVIGFSSIVKLANAGGVIKLLAMDPDGDCIGPSAAMSRVDPGMRSEKIRLNLNLIRNQLQGVPGRSALRHVSLRVVDALLPISVIAIDQESSNGSLIVQHHLTATHAEEAPMICLSRKDDPEWFQCYLDQCMACFTGANEW
jgi:hypothetical protein